MPGKKHENTAANCDNENILTIVDSSETENSINTGIRNFRQNTKFIENALKCSGVDTGYLGQFNRIAAWWNHLQTIRSGEAAKVPIDIFFTKAKGELFKSHPVAWLAIEASSRIAIELCPHVIAPNENYIAERMQVEQSIADRLRPDQQVYLDTPLSEEVASAVGSLKAILALANFWQKPGRVVYDNLVPEEVKALSQGVKRLVNSIGDDLVLYEHDRQKMLGIVEAGAIDPDFPLTFSDARILLYPLGEPALKCVQQVGKVAEAEASTPSIQPAEDNRQDPEAVPTIFNREKVNTPKANKPKIKFNKIQWSFNLSDCLVLGVNIPFELPIQINPFINIGALFLKKGVEIMVTVIKNNRLKRLSKSAERYYAEAKRKIDHTFNHPGNIKDRFMNELQQCLGGVWSDDAVSFNKLSQLKNEFVNQLDVIKKNLNEGQGEHTKALLKSNGHEESRHFKPNQESLKTDDYKALETVNDQIKAWKATLADFNPNADIGSLPSLQTVLQGDMGFDGTLLLYKYLFSIATSIKNVETADQSVSVLSILENLYDSLIQMKHKDEFSGLALTNIQESLENLRKARDELNTAQQGLLKMAQTTRQKNFEDTTEIEVNDTPKLRPSDDVTIVAKLQLDKEVEYFFSSIKKLLDENAGLDAFDEAFNQIKNINFDHDEVLISRIEAMLMACYERGKLSQNSAETLCSSLLKLHEKKMALIDNLIATDKVVNPDHIRTAFLLLNNLSFMARISNSYSASEMITHFLKLEIVLDAVTFDDFAELAYKKAIIKVAIGDLSEAKHILQDATQRELPPESLKMLRSFSDQIDRMRAEYNMNVVEVFQLVASYAARFFGKADSTVYLSLDSFLEVVSRYFQYYATNPDILDREYLSIFLIAPLLLADNVFQYFYNQQTTETDRRTWFFKMTGLRFATVFATALNFSYQNVRNSEPLSLLQFTQKSFAALMKLNLLNRVQSFVLGKQLASAFQMALNYYKQGLLLEHKQLPESYGLALLESFSHNPAANILSSCLTAMPVLIFLEPMVMPIASYFMATQIGNMLTGLVSIVPGIKVAALVWTIGDLYYGTLNFHARNVFKNVALLIDQGKYLEARTKLNKLAYDTTLESCSGTFLDKLFLTIRLDSLDGNRFPSQILLELKDVAERLTMQSSISYYTQTPGCSYDSSNSYQLFYHLALAFLQQPCNMLSPCKGQLKEILPTMRALSLPSDLGDDANALIEKMRVYARDIERGEISSDEALAFYDQLTTRARTFYLDMMFRVGEKIIHNNLRENKSPYKDVVSLNLSMVRDIVMHSQFSYLSLLGNPRRGFSLSDWLFFNDKTFIPRLINHYLSYKSGRVNGNYQHRIFSIQLLLSSGFAFYYLYSHFNSQSRGMPCVDLLALMNLFYIEIVQINQFLLPLSRLTLRHGIYKVSYFTKRYSKFFGLDDMSFYKKCALMLLQIPLQYPDLLEIIYQTDPIYWVGNQLSNLVITAASAVPPLNVFLEMLATSVGALSEWGSYALVFLLKILNYIAASPIPIAGFSMLALYALYQIIFCGDNASQDDFGESTQHYITAMQGTSPKYGRGAEYHISKSTAQPRADSQLSVPPHNNFRLFTWNLRQSGQVIPALPTSSASLS